MYLLDTNILLEILLKQARAEDCKRFMKQNESSILISDFTLHSIGVILYRMRKSDLFTTFVTDILGRDILVSLDRDLYSDL
jgi:predicted nucleic acid-binding protein